MKYRYINSVCRAVFWHNSELPMQQGQNWQHSTNIVCIRVMYLCKCILLYSGSRDVRFDRNATNDARYSAYSCRSTTETRVVSRGLQTTLRARGREREREREEEKGNRTVVTSSHGGVPYWPPSKVTNKSGRHIENSDREIERKRACVALASEDKSRVDDGDIGCWGLERKDERYSRST